MTNDVKLEALFAQIDEINSQDPKIDTIRSPFQVLEFFDQLADHSFDQDL